MLGKRSVQENMFTVDQQYLSFIGEDSFYGYLAAHRHELFDDEDFGFLYCRDNGRASVPPSVLATTLLLQWYDGVADQEAVDRAKYDLRWKVALGLTMEEEPFVKSTLQLFRTQLIVHKQARKLFEASLSHARQKRFFRSPKLKVALDTTPIFGKGAVEDTYNLLAEALRQVLHVLADLQDTEYERFAGDHGFDRYVQSSFKGSFTIDWDDDDQRQTVLTALVADGERGLALARTILAQYPDTSDQAQRILQSVELLSQILAQDVQRTPSGEAQLIQGVAPERIVSVHDPEMRHGRKSVSQRFDGYKAAIAVDVDQQLITAVDVLPANAHDAEGAQMLVEQSERNTQTQVETVIGDTAYGTLEQRLASHTNDRLLVAPVPKPPATGRFTKADFQIDPSGESVRCPAGETTSLWYGQKRTTRRGTSFLHKAFRFPQNQCHACALRSRCLKPGARWRSLTVNQHEDLLQAAHQFQRTDRFRQLYRLRVTVEHRIARMIQLGMRNARYFGSSKVLFQIAMVAAVANLTLIAGRTTLGSFFVALLALAVASTIAHRFSYKLWGLTAVPIEIHRSIHCRPPFVRPKQLLFG